MKIAIGSKNPFKIAATRQAFASIWPSEELEMVATTVPSGVSDQPLTTDETIRGAINRAKTVKVTLRPDFAVGIEAGLTKIDDKWFVDGWVAVIDKNGKIGLGGSPAMEATPQVMKLIKSGHEIREACKMIFGDSNVEQSQGYFGVMTGNFFTSTDGFCDAIIMALARFMRPEAFDQQ
jgi:inosine/xanthosine triphosphatase